MEKSIIGVSDSCWQIAMDKRIYDVPAMLRNADKIFADWAAMGKPQDRFGKVALAKRKIYESRGWLPSKLYIEKNFDELLQTLRVFYLPKAHIHGPAFVFPIRDLEVSIRRHKSGRARAVRCLTPTRNISVSVRAATMHFRARHGLGMIWRRSAG